MNTEDQDEFRSLTRRLYEVVSSSPAQHHWESIRDLYHPRATLVRTGLDAEGRPFVLAMTFDEYVANVTDHLATVEFSEQEISQEVTVFGNIARLSSVYEYRFQESGKTRRGRGANFFNLVNEGGGWKIMNIVWDNERDGVSLRASELLEAEQ